MSRKEKTTVTIYDVARRAGVAISTVSRVLNDSPDVSDRTRSAVHQAIDELKFHPSRTARSLAQQEYHSFAVAIPSFTAPFQNELLKGIRSYLQEPGLDLLICDLGSTHIEKTLRSFLSRGAVRGLLVCGVQLSDTMVEDLMDVHSPTVLVGCSAPHFDSFTWDDVKGVEAGVCHLINQGHQHIGMIRASLESDTQRLRIQGYHNAIVASDLPFDEKRIVAGQRMYHAGYSEEDGYDAMMTMLDLFPDTTAVMTSCDVQAIGALAALKDRKLRVPEDVAVVGYDNIKTSRFLGLSSVSQSMQEIGYSSAKRLHDRILGNVLGPAVHTIIQPKLEIRASSSS